MALASRGKPEWLKIRASEEVAENVKKLRAVLRKHELVTVCEESKCPNIPICWGGGDEHKSTATFMIMGDVCTRGCRFCDVKTGKPCALDLFEPMKLAAAIAEMKLDYVVITSVDRDDLPDQGSAHFAACIKAVKEEHPGVLVEVLIPDFRGDTECIRRVVEAKPDVIAHNVETVRRLQRTARDPRAGYEQSIGVLRAVKQLDANIFTKSSIIVGFGETEEEMIQAMEDLRAAAVDFLTVGQYLRPSSWHLDVQEYVPPFRFERYQKLGEAAGFFYVAAGPFVRSSFRAGELFVRMMKVTGKSPTPLAPLQQEMIAPA